MNTYIVTVRGFPPREFNSASAAGARYQAFRAYREGYPCTFREFIDLSAVTLKPDSGTPASPSKQTNVPNACSVENRTNQWEK